MLLLLSSVIGLLSFSHSMPLARRLIDMTYVFDETTLRFPGYKEFKIDHLFNETYEGLASSWLQFEEFSSTTHTGTHIDAPAHNIKGEITVEQIRLEDLFAPAAVIDITAKAETDPDAEATTEDLLRWEAGTGQSLNGAIILLKSGWGRKWNDSQAFFGNPDYGTFPLHFPGISADACQWLVENRSIKGIGTETASIDKGSTTTFPAHAIILGHKLFILENVANIDKLPIYGANLFVLPMKVGKGSGAPTRIIASIPEVIYKMRINVREN
ncbi:isatin hydrolase isoform X2 [Parasteatoda tepidariorum]|uniref:isatin hydrolase isoform X2 n=1 Tax=Parasteatoda tepidariorum TaxID=114398 RepID=UPI00077FD08A|nr:isatin hydrolase isoform X1 [Parasteatoda tepidariorum]